VSTVHKYPFLQILSWWLDGIWRHVLTTTGLTWLLPGNESPPGFWYIWFSWWDWIWNLSSSGKVNETITRNWLWACHRLWGNWTDEVGDYAKTSAVNLVRLWQIAAGSSVFNIQTWFGVLVAWLGARSLSWASDVTEALGTLRDYFPAGIADGWRAWTDLWDNIQTSLINWCKARYDDAIAGATDAWNWIVATGNALKSWYDVAHTWLDDFRQNAAARVTDWLGATWTNAVTFFTSAGTFWYNLWGSYATEIGKFWPDPLGYVYDRVEDYLCGKW